MLIRAALIAIAIAMAANGSLPLAHAVAPTASTDRVITTGPPFLQSPCDYRNKRTGECVEGVDDNSVGATAECGDGLYSHSVTRSGIFQGPVGVRRLSCRSPGWRAGLVG